MDTEDNVEALAKLATAVENNCEFLTCVRYANARSEVGRSSLRTLEEFWSERGNSKLNNEGMLQLIVELVYFHYACRNFQAAPVIAPSNVRVEETVLRNSERRFSVVVWYELQEGELQDGYVSNSLVSLLNYLQEMLGEYLLGRKEEKERPAPEQELEMAIETFFLQFAALAANEYFREHEPVFFLALEQATVFYEHSAFYRIKNCSMLDFIKCE
jgi:hypothetical protein